MLWSVMATRPCGRRLRVVEDLRGRNFRLVGSRAIG
jgi:hypothetical protein